jgi:hypothetical protein
MAISGVLLFYKIYVDLDNDLEGSIKPKCGKLRHLDEAWMTISTISDS